MATRKFYAAAAAATIAFLVFFAQACSKKEAKEPETIAPVQTAAVQQGSIRRIIKAQAILYACNQAAVASKINAPVSQFHVNRGDRVRKGQLLAELENRDLAAAAAEAKGNFDQAAANYRNTTAAALPDEIVKSQSDVQSSKEMMEAAQRVYESRKKLLDEGAIPRKQLDEAQVALIQARTQYETARKHLESMQQVSKEAQAKAMQGQMEAAKSHQEATEVQLQYSKIFSPIDGVVVDRPLYAGEMAGSGAALITIMDISSVIARASVPIGALHFLKVGNDATIAAPEGTEIHGKITVVSPALDPNSTTAEVWIKGTNPGERLRPGATVQVALAAETVKDALLIPVSAILHSQESAEDAVLVVDKDSLAHERKIEIGIRENDTIQILKGLALGERVVTVGGVGVQDKTKVKVESAGAKANAAEKE